MYAALKPWMDFPEQVRLLQERGMRIDNVERAEKYLRRIGYYRLSGYAHVFRQWDSSNQKLLDEFYPESDFETVLSLYLFDKKLRLLALDALERIEMAVRVEIVHILGKYDPMAHKDGRFFHGNFAKKIKKGSDKTEHQKWLERFDQLEKQAKKRRLPLLEHNMGKYGCLPIWAASCLWDFGAMTWLYEGMKYADKNYIAEKYGAVDGESFLKWLNSLNEIRNIAAHHDRLWNIKISRTSSPIKEDRYWENLDNTRPFFYFCIMQKMMKILCPNSKWAERFDELLQQFPQYCHGSKVDLSRFGLPEDYKKWTLWQK